MTQEQQSQFRAILVDVGGTNVRMELADIKQEKRGLFFKKYLTNKFKLFDEFLDQFMTELEDFDPKKSVLILSIASKVKVNEFLIH